LTTLTIKWGAPLIDPSTIEEDPAWHKLDDVTQAVLSMRAIACTASLLPQNYHLCLAADNVILAKSFRDYGHQVLCVSLRESMLNQLLIGLRLMHMDLDRRRLVAPSYQFS
jgi:hypothetical protein